MISTEELETIMSNCCGTEHYHKAPLVPFMHTDGVETFVEHAQAFWFIGECFTAYVRHHEEPFLLFRLKVEGSKALLEVEDGDCKVLETRKIPFTDCPDGEWVFYLCDDVLMWHMEY